MTKKELVMKLRELLDSTERLQSSIRTASDEIDGILHELEGMPETVEEIEDE